MIIDDTGARLPTVTDDGIYGFFGEYRFLSNFEVCPVFLDGIAYQSSEAAFMAQKTTNKDDQRHIATLSPNKAKQFGRTVVLRPDWDHYRVIAMTRAVAAKFSQNPALMEKLLATGNKYLEETNNWHDQFWGVEDLIGKNMLGHTLMTIREIWQP